VTALGNQKPSHGRHPGGETLDGLLALLSAPTRNAISAILRFTLDLSTEERLLLANLLDGTNPYRHPNTLQTCNECNKERTLDYYSVRDPTIHISYEDCAWTTLA
jgi:hypothetical protein